MTIKPWDIKLARADEHTASLRQEVASFLATGDFALRRDWEGDALVLRAVRKVEVPHRFSAIIGDVLHNVRSALDCVVWTLATEYGTGPALEKRQESGIGFPITDSLARWNDAVGRSLRNVHPDAVEEIRRHQPWRLADEVNADTPGFLDDQAVQNTVRFDQLRRLGVLSNADKHRQVHLTGGLVDYVYVGLPEGLTMDWTPGVGTFTNGSEYGRWTANRELIPDEVSVGSEVTLALEEDIKDGTAQPVVGVMQTLLGNIRGNVLPTLTRHLKH